MGAVSVGESESLKMQDPFKQYVKLSRLKIYGPCVHEGYSFSSCFLRTTMEVANLRSWDEGKPMHQTNRSCSSPHTQNTEGLTCCLVQRHKFGGQKNVLRPYALACERRKTQVGFEFRSSWPSFKGFVEETLVDSVLAAAKGCDQKTIKILLEASGQQLMRITAAKCESSQGALIIHNSLTTESWHGRGCNVHAGLGRGKCSRTIWEAVTASPHTEISQLYDL